MLNLHKIIVLFREGSQLCIFLSFIKKWEIPIIAMEVYFILSLQHSCSFIFISLEAFIVNSLLYVLFFGKDETENILLSICLMENRGKVPKFINSLL